MSRKWLVLLQDPGQRLDYWINEYSILAGHESSEQICGHGKIAGLYDLQNSAARIGLQNRMQDDVSRVELGLKVPEPITDREWIASMPLSATPQERMQLQQSYQRYQQTLAMQPAYQTIVQGDAQQGMAAVNAMKPDVSDPDFTFKQQRYAQVASKFAQVQKAREDDPGTWLLQNSPVIKDVYDQFSQRQVTGEFFASRIQAEKALGNT